MILFGVHSKKSLIMINHSKVSSAKYRQPRTRSRPHKGNHNEWMTSFLTFFFISIYHLSLVMQHSTKLIFYRKRPPIKSCCTINYLIHNFYLFSLHATIIWSDKTQNRKYIALTFGSFSWHITQQCTMGKFNFFLSWDEPEKFGVITKNY